jgi:hypothetical protein
MDSPPNKREIIPPWAAEVNLNVFDPKNAEIRRFYGLEMGLTS